MPENASIDVFEVGASAGAIPPVVGRKLTF